MEKLETKLIKESWISPNQFIKAKEEQEKTGKCLYSILIKLGFMAEDDVYMFFAHQANISFVRLSEYKLDKNLLALFPEESYRERLFLPIFKIENALYICMANPLDADFMNTLEMQTNFEIYPLFGCPSAILAAIDSFFGPDDKCFNLEDLIVSPPSLGEISLWRESERVSIVLPVEFKPEDERVKLVFSSYISATATDMSTSGKALGIKTFIFIPPHTTVFVKFSSLDPSYEAKAEVMRCNLVKGGEYFLGVKFVGIKEALVKSILGSANPSP